MPASTSVANAKGRFFYDGVAKPEFTVRRPEEEALLALVKAGRRIRLDGPRRCGKTTLVANTLSRHDIEALNIDLLGVTTLPKLMERVAENAETFLATHPGTRDRLFGKNGLKFGGELSLLKLAKVTAETTSEQESKPGTSLDALLRIVSEVAKDAGAVVVVDEFQATRHPNMTNPVEVEGSFATASDPSRTKGKNSWLFLGSHRLAMHQIFSVPESAFALRMETLPVGPIPQESIIPFLNKRSGRKVDAAVGEEAYRWTEGIPGDLQRLYSAMVELTSSPAPLKLDELAAAQDLVMHEVGRISAPSLSGMESDQPDQLRLLRLVASEDIRDVNQLAKVADANGIKPKAAGAALTGLVRSGILHYDSEKGPQLERPEPILFHYLADAGARSYTVASALENAFRALPKPGPAPKAATSVSRTR